MNVYEGAYIHTVQCTVYTVYNTVVETDNAEEKKC